MGRRNRKKQIVDQVKSDFLICVLVFQALAVINVISFFN